MCGSGTILIEAAMMAKNIAPNINRDAYCFKNWKDFNPTLYKKVITQAKLNTIETDCQFLDQTFLTRI